MIILYDVHRRGKFVMRASLQGLALFLPIDGPTAARVVYEQHSMKSDSPTIVASCGTPPDVFSVVIATEVLGTTVEDT